MRTRITVELLPTLDEEGRKLDPGSLADQEAHEGRIGEALETLSKAVDTRRMQGWAESDRHGAIAVVKAMRDFAGAMGAAHDKLVAIEDEDEPTGARRYGRRSS